MPGLRWPSGDGRVRERGRRGSSRDSTQEPEPDLLTSESAAVRVRGATAPLGHRRSTPPHLDTPKPPLDASKASFLSAVRRLDLVDDPGGATRLIIHLAPVNPGALLRVDRAARGCSLLRAVSLRSSRLSGVPAARARAEKPVDAHPFLGVAATGVEPATPGVTERLVSGVTVASPRIRAITTESALLDRPKRHRAVWGVVCRKFAAAAVVREGDAREPDGWSTFAVVRAAGPPGSRSGIRYVYEPSWGSPGQARNCVHASYLLIRHPGKPSRLVHFRFTSAVGGFAVCLPEGSPGIGFL